MSKAPQTGAGLSGPPADLARDGEALLLTVSLPGLSAQDFRVSLVGSRQVHIEGTVPYRYPVPQDHLTQAERSYGPFSRTLELPLPVDSSRAQVGFQNGLLTLRLPVQAQPFTLRWV